MKIAKTIKEADEFINSINGNLLVPKQKQVNLVKEIGSNLKNFLKEGGYKQDVLDKETGIVTTVDTSKSITPEAVKKGLRTLYMSNPDMKSTVDQQRSQYDTTDLDLPKTDEGNIEWLYRNYGEPFVDKKDSRSISKLSGFSSGEKEFKEVQVLSGNLTTDLSTKTDLKFSAEGEKPIGFKEKQITVNTGSEAVTKTGGIRSKPSETIKFTPINSAEYYYTKVSRDKSKVKVTQADIDRGDYKQDQLGKVVVKRVPAGTIINKDMLGHYKPNEVGKRRNSLLIIVPAGTNLEPLLIPYDAIKDKMEANYPELKKAMGQLKDNIPSYSRDYLIQEGYSDRQIDEAVKLGKIKLQ